MRLRCPPIRIPVLTVFLLAAAACTQQEHPRPDCAIDAGPCVKIVDGMTVTLDVAPRPVRAMRELAFTVQLGHGAQVFREGNGEIDLTMPGMEMGENRVLLERQGDGTLRGTGVFLRCPSGQKLWNAKVTIDIGERAVAADYRFEVP